jgi:hypothetical protein
MMPRKIEEAEPAGACPMADGRAADRKTFGANDLYDALGRASKKRLMSNEIRTAVHL